MGQHSFRLKPLAVRFSLFLFVLSLINCSRSAPPPVLSPWSEQVAAAERAVQGKGEEFMLVDAGALPLRQQPGASGEPIEMSVYIFFASPKASQLAGENQPHYEARMVKYNDYHLATTLRVENLRRSIEDEKNSVGLSGVRVGPQEVLKSTLTEGEAFMGRPVDRGNIDFRLLRGSEARLSPELKAPAIWKISYLSEKGSLDFWVDAQTGETLKRSKEEK